MATTGSYGRYRDGTLPRHFSPCGEVLDRDDAILMHEPVRRYPYIADLHAPVREVLLVPFHHMGRPVGMLWVVSHDDTKTFAWSTTSWTWPASATAPPQSRIAEARCVIQPVA